MKREWGNVESESFSISSFSLHFLYISSSFPHYLSISSHSGCKDAVSHATLIGCMTNIKEIAIFNCSSNSLFRYLDLLGAVLKVGESPPGDVDSGSRPSQLQSDPWFFVGQFSKPPKMHVINTYGNLETWKSRISILNLFRYPWPPLLPSKLFPEVTDPCSLESHIYWRLMF